MTGVIFLQTLRFSWRQALYWGLGVGVLGAYMGFVIPDVDMLKQYAALFESLPPVLLQMLGAESAQALATPEGFIAFGFYGYSLLVLAVYAVIAGLNVTANEEDAGIMDVLLSAPVPRWRVVVEKFAAYVVISLAIIVISFGLLWATLEPSSIKIDTGLLVMSSINMLPGLLVMIAFTLFAGAFARRKSTATAAAATFIVGSYFIDFIGGAASGTLADSLRSISFFSYYDPSGVMENGLNVGHVGLLLAVSAALVAGGAWLFQRRDIGV